MLCRCLIALVFAVLASVQAHAAGKVALVIGNGAYQNANPLPNPTNDAADMTAKLKELGFEVFGGNDLTFVDMGTKIGEFEDAARDADVTLLFYAGHGMQVNGRNYLVPVDAKLERESSLKFQTIDAEDVLRAMAGPGKTAIALLDACRDNPLSRRFSRSLGASRSNAVQQGLAVPNITGGGMLIGFATAPGDVAADGDGRNSPFTTALLKNISTPGLEIQQLMTRVKREVYDTTKENQEPWHNSSLRDEIYLGGEAAAPAPKVEADNTNVSAEWNLVKDTSSVAVLDAFIAAYGDKPLFVALAQDRRNLLTTQEAAASAKAKTDAEQAALAATDAVAAEQKARLEEIERQRAELDKSQAELDAAKAEKQKVREEAQKLKAEQEAALAEIARQKAEIAKSMDLLEAQLQAKLPPKQDPPPQPPVVVDPPQQVADNTAPPGEEVGKDSFLNFFFGETPDGKQDAATPPPAVTPPPEQQLALNDAPPPAPPAATGNAAFDEFLIAAIAANNGEISQAFMMGNQVVLLPPAKNPGTKAKPMAAKRIASAASMDALLQANPELSFESTSAQSCRVDFINSCKFLPQALRDSIAERFGSLGVDISGQLASSSYFFAQPLAGSDFFLISNSPHLKADNTPAAVVATIVDAKLTVQKSFYIPLSNANQGVQADPQFGNISITWAALEGEDLILSLDSGSRCDEKPRFMGIMLRASLIDMSVKWVSPFNVVNDNFIITDSAIYSADGGSCQEDYIYQLDKATGKVLSRLRVKTSADELWLSGDKLVVQLYEGAEAYQLK